ncbi:CidA/LrgA family protein [Enterococcus nangangensis]|uniref:CidA/LrgA family protein n=1 Tax=Enterococcus nangangensis TaxID=2559926 RepID=UPI0010F934BC|nr:CidA/LrgA family protein [Enterococcus nangangensis]
MKIYLQLFYILLCSFLGEILKHLLGLPIPGSVLGMLVLFLALQTKILKVEDVKEVGAFLLGNLTILFVPAGVGIMVNFTAIQDVWYILVGVSLVITAVVMGLTGRLVQFVKVKFEGDYAAPHSKEVETSDE